MASASLNAIPSPESPSDLVENPTVQFYYRIYEACTSCIKVEKDPLRRLELEKTRAFVDSVIRELEDGEQMAGPPAPLPPPLASAAGAPPAGGMQPPQPAAPPPVIPGGTPPAMPGS